MKQFIFVHLLFCTVLFASNIQNKILEKQMAKQMAKEKVYAKEQKFYNQDNYDFKGSEVNEESLKYIKAIEVEDLDMDSVYD
jgi:hypothetical protein